MMYGRDIISHIFGAGPVCLLTPGCHFLAAVALPSAVVCAVSMESVRRGGAGGATLWSISHTVCQLHRWLIKVTTGVCSDEWTIDVTDFS